MTMLNIPLNGTDDDINPFEVTRGLKILLASTTIPIFIIGAFGNISVLVAVMKSRNLRTVSNIFTVSLIGLSFLIICYGYPLQQLMDVFLIRTQPWCYLFGSSMLSISVQFTMVMLFVTIERYVTICLPFTAHAIFTPRNVLATILFLLVYGLCAGMGAGGVIWRGKDDLWMTERRCNIISMIPSPRYILVLMVHWLLPLPVMIVIYLRIFVVVRRHIKAMTVLVPATMPAPSWKGIRARDERRPASINDDDSQAGNGSTPGEQPVSACNSSKAPAMTNRPLTKQASLGTHHVPMEQPVHVAKRSSAPMTAGDSPGNQPPSLASNTSGEETAPFTSRVRAPRKDVKSPEKQPSFITHNTPTEQPASAVNRDDVPAIAAESPRRQPAPLAFSIPREQPSEISDGDRPPEQDNKPQLSKAHRRLIKEAKSALVLFVIVLTYFFCWVPFSIFAVAGILSGESVSPEGFVIIHCVVYSSGFITPYVYGFSNKKIRTTLTAMFFGRRGWNSSAGDNSSIPTN